MPDEANAIRLSVIAPARDEAGCIEEFVQRVSATLKSADLEHEIIIIDDHSTDDTLSSLKSMAQLVHTLRVVSLNGRGGQSAAIDAGLRICRGQLVAVMDSDLQDVPEELPKLIAKIQDGADLVSGYRMLRADRFWTRRLPSRTANSLVRFLTGCPTHDVGGMCLMRGDIARQLRLDDGMHRFLPVLVHLQGGRIDEVAVSRPPRKSGKSHYTLLRTAAVVRDLTRLWWQSRHSTSFTNIKGHAGSAIGVESESGRRTV